MGDNSTLTQFFTGCHSKKENKWSFTASITFLVFEIVHFFPANEKKGLNCKELQNLKKIKLGHPVKNKFNVQLRAHEFYKRQGGLKGEYVIME